jgi:metal-responsive CopG/Arc/MetJ family transcriptional regulator
MAAKPMTITLDETVVDKLDWIMKNSAQASKSGLIARLVELEFFRLKKIRQEDLVL